MRIMFVAMLVATVMLADSTTAAPPATLAAEAAQPAKKKAEGDTVCKSEPVLGSRMPVKKCRSAAQVAQDKVDAQADLAKAQGANANNPH